MSICVHGIKPYYMEQTAVLFCADTFDALKRITPERVDMIFADPPYFLSNDGISCSGGKAASVNKGDWDKIGSLDEKHEFNREWIRLCKRALKPNGSIWISGTLHNIYSVGMALEQEGYKIINNITWQKTNPLRIWPAVVLRTARRPCCGRAKMTRPPAISLIAN